MATSNNNVRVITIIMESFLTQLPTEVCIGTLAEWCTMKHMAKLDTAMTNSFNRQWFLGLIQSKGFVVNFNKRLFQPHLDFAFSVVVECFYYTKRYRLCRNWMELRQVQMSELCVHHDSFYCYGILKHNLRISSVTSLLLINKSVNSNGYDDVAAKVWNASTISKLIENCPRLKYLRAFDIMITTPLKLTNTTIRHLISVSLGDCAVEMIVSICSLAVNVERLHASTIRASDLLSLKFTHDVITACCKLQYCSLFGTGHTQDTFADLMEVLFGKSKCVVSFQIDCFSVHTGGNTDHNQAKVRGLSVFLTDFVLGLIPPQEPKMVLPEETS